MDDHGAALEAGLDEMVACTDRLLDTVDAMSEGAPAGASLLPDWTRAHVLTHIARNADGLVNLALAARTGEDRPMYAGGKQGRDAEIEAGATRHLGDLRLDVADSAERLLDAFVGFPEEALHREVTFASGASAYGWELPVLRVREVQIHHVDLDSGFTPGDWSLEFATRTLDQLGGFFREARECPVAFLAATDTDRRWQVADDGPELSGPTAALAAWLTGRSSDDGSDDLVLRPAGQVPPAPRWV